MTGNRDVLSRGQAFSLLAGGGGSVGEFIGAGGQGSVYVADCAGRTLALKWYHPQVVLADVGLRSRIARMIEQGPPDRNFVWPLEFVGIEGLPSFGYLMPLISGDRRPLKDLFAPPPKNINPPLAPRASACFDIASSFQKLHATGYCYQDINLGGFFIDPLRGSVQICDADNISVDGELGGVYGTRKFMAPEVVLRKAIPSTASDLYSMAVLLFYILFNWHPLDGKRVTETKIMDQAAEMRLYAQTPRFLFDPLDQSNGPAPGVHDWVVARWKAMTAPIRALFTRVFTLGLAQPGARPVEGEWRGALDHLRNSIVACPSCAFEHGLDRESWRGGAHCVACGASLAAPPLLTAGYDPLLLTSRRTIFGYQLTSWFIDDDASPLASVASHPRDAAILGLQNLAASQWSARTADGRRVDVGPGKTVRVVEGLDIDFGERHGVITNAAPARPGSAT